MIPCGLPENTIRTRNRTALDAGRAESTLRSYPAEQSKPDAASRQKTPTPPGFFLT